MRTFNNQSEVEAFLVGNIKAWRVLFAAEVGHCTPAEAAAVLKIDGPSFGWARAVAFTQTARIADPIRYPGEQKPAHNERVEAGARGYDRAEDGHSDSGEGHG